MVLQTAFPVVTGNSESRVRVLFDTGSHKSFITVKAVSILGLRPVRKECLRIKGENVILVEALVVNDISDIPNVHVETVKKKFSHLANF